MTEKKKSKTEEPKKKRELFRNIWLVGLGTVAATGDGAVKLYGFLREQGVAFESRHKDGLDGARDRVVKVSREAKTRIESGYRQVSEKVEGKVSSAMSRVGVGRRELGALNERVEELSAKVEQLKPELANQSRISR
jgi:poly(hydroxyalkanoate) granule-associated protein